MSRQTNMPQVKENSSTLQQQNIVRQKKFKSFDLNPISNRISADSSPQITIQNSTELTIETSH